LKVCPVAEHDLGPVETDGAHIDLDLVGLRCGHLDVLDAQDVSIAVFVEAYDAGHGGSFPRGGFWSDWIPADGEVGDLLVARTSGRRSAPVHSHVDYAGEAHAEIGIGIRRGIAQSLLH